MESGTAKETPRALLATDRLQDTQLIVRQLPWTLLRPLDAVWSACTARRCLRIAGVLAVAPLVFAALAIFYVNFNRTSLPDLEGFVRFEPPTVGHVYDAKGQVLIELANERRQILQYGTKAGRCPIPL